MPWTYILMLGTPWPLFEHTKLLPLNIVLFNWFIHDFFYFVPNCWFFNYDFLWKEQIHFFYNFQGPVRFSPLPFFLLRPGTLDQFRYLHIHFINFAWLYFMKINFPHSPTTQVCLVLKNLTFDQKSSTEGPLICVLIYIWLGYQDIPNDFWSSLNYDLSNWHNVTISNKQGNPLNNISLLKP